MYVGTEVTFYPHLETTLSMIFTSEQCFCKGVIGEKCFSSALLITYAVWMSFIFSF